MRQNDGGGEAAAEDGAYGEYQGGPVSLHAMDLSPSAACGPTSWLTTTTEFAVVGGCTRCISYPELESTLFHFNQP